mmetsp:Transcript_477/g.667  ORF Transcript_477/g.667 Transcript_477/m.667 type:complete len:308 (+) Transcript_477:216-1139(+)
MADREAYDDGRHGERHGRHHGEHRHRGESHHSERKHRASRRFSLRSKRDSMMRSESKSSGRRSSSMDSYNDADSWEPEGAVRLLRSDSADAGPPLPEELFERTDVSPDGTFYKEPRMVTHIADSTIEALTMFYRDFLPEKSAILDLCSSWTSHLPEDVHFSRVSGHGMNSEELRANTRLTDFVVQDLNQRPELPFPNATFDRILMVVSIQYLTLPVEVFIDSRRMLRPGGRVAIAISNRMFPTKAIKAFQVFEPKHRIELVGSYLRRAGFVNVQYVDKTPADGDPLWIVIGSKAVPRRSIVRLLTGR